MRFFEDLAQSLEPAGAVVRSDVVLLVEREACSCKFIFQYLFGDSLGKFPRAEKERVLTVTEVFGFGSLCTLVIFRT